MNMTSFCSVMLLLFPTGCALLNPSQPPWEIEPTMTLRHSGENAHARYELGRYYRGQRRLDQAEKEFLRAIELDERLADAYNALGALYAEQGELARAVEMFERVTAMAPESAYLQNNLGYALWLAGHPEEAVAAIRRALALDPGFRRAWDNLARIAAATGDSALVAEVQTRQVTETVLPIALRSSEQLAALPADGPGGHRWVAGEIRQSGGFQPVSAPLDAGAKVVRAELAAVPAAPVDSALAPSGAAKPEPGSFRLEVSNGNGLTGFAARLGKRLRDEGIAVSRLSNQRPYTVATTSAEYQPGYEAAAKAVMTRAGVNGNVVAASQPRRGADVRLVLGRDAAAVSGMRAAASDLPRS